MLTRVSLMRAALLVSIAALVATNAHATFLPLDFGNIWEYRTLEGDRDTRTVDGTEMIFGVETAVIRYTDSTQNPGLRNFWTTSEEGSVYLWGFYRPDIDLGYVYDPPIAMVQAPLTVGSVWQQTIDFYSYPDIAFLFTVEFEFEVVGAEMLDVPAGSYFAYEVVMRVLSARSLPVSAVGLDLGTRSGDVLDRDWWSEDVGEVQYGLLDLYQLVSFNGPTPVVSISWGEAKVRFRVADSENLRPSR